MGKSSPPPAPDYAAAARETAAGNAEQALIAQYGSMTNQVTPYGQVNYTSQQVGKTSEGNPLNQWTQTVTMTPEQQALFNQNQAINQQLGDVAQSGVGYVQNAMANPLQGQELANNLSPTAQKMASGINMPTLANQIRNAGEISSQIDSAGNITRGFDNTANRLQTSVQDPNLLLQDTTNALYRANTQYLDPQFEQDQADLENKLANQGITQGSEAYNRAMGNFELSKQRAYESARNAAIGGGMQAAQGMFGMNLQGGQFANQALGQAYNQNLGAAGFGNQAQNQLFAQNQAAQQAQNAAQQQAFAQNMANAQFQNQAAQGMFGMGMQNAALQNQAANQEFQQALQSGQFQNQTAAQKLAQAQTLQQNPINMLNAVRTGSQMQVAQMPQVGVSQAAPLQAVAGPDLLGAAQGQYSAATGANNASNAQSSSALQGGLGAGLALAGMFF